MIQGLLAGAGLGLLLASTSIAMAHAATPADPSKDAPKNAPGDADVAALLSDWTGPNGGLVPFDRVKVAAMEPALEEAMRLDQAEIDAIAGDPRAATFANTIVPLERSGQALDRALTLYGVWKSNLKTPDVQALETRMEPVLAAFADRIYQNERLFARIDAVYQARERSGLTPEQQRVVWKRWNDFVKQGAKLSPAAKERVTAINQRLASLYAQFMQNLLADEAGHVLYLNEADLAGLPPSLRDAFAEDAKDRGRPGQWAVANTRSAMEPFLTYSGRRDLRERVWRTYYSRGDNKDAHDNTLAVIPEILRLRYEKARLMGLPSYAAWKMQDTMARTPEAAMAQMMQVWPAAIGRVREEVAAMQAVADKEIGGKAPAIAPWDYRYYAEKVRKAKYDLDMQQVKPYLQLDKLREGMFWAAGRLYGFTFAKAEGVPTFAPEMSVYEVKDAAGRHVALWYFDPYARPIKASGAWMAQYRSQQKDTPATAIVSNNTNFVKPPPGQPVLISWDDAVTLFHEFGHALHAMNSDVTYPSVSGTNVDRDFVEFPSQINENWLPTREVLSRFAVNQQGAPIPQDLVAKILKAQTFNTGFAVTEYLAAAIMDMKLHTTPQGPGDAPIDPDRFEKETLAALGMPPEIVMRHRTSQFFHVFQGDGYAAGYYSYLWAEVLDHDAFEAFTEAGGPWDPAVAKRLKDDILSVGDTVDPAEAFRRFRGRDPRVDAYLKAKGFAPTAP
jgi:peptidyl-dipeptidase Dcp